jgi:membrane-bound ClpP family serine protease
MHASILFVSLVAVAAPDTPETRDVKVQPPATEPEDEAKGDPVREAKQPVVVQMVLDSEITSATRDYLFAALAHAETIKASALLITLDTPGGLMEATREMVREMLKARARLRPASS